MKPQYQTARDARNAKDATTYYEVLEALPEELDDEYEYYEVDEDAARISLCTLGSINWGAFRNPEDMRRACRILQRSLCNILDYQDFLSIQSKLSNDEIQPLGIGITNLAYWHAKRSYKYVKQKHYKK